MSTSQQLKARIMRRVYGIWFVRRVLPPVAGVVFFGFIALRETASEFFVAKIVSNFLGVAFSNFWAVPGFVGSAVMHASAATLFIIAFSILATFILSVRLLQNIRRIMNASSMQFGLDYRKW